MRLKEVLNENIFESDTLFNQCHASTILKCGGTLLCAWFAGTKEGNDDVKIYLSTNAHGEWSTPKVMSHTDSVPCWNPVLFEKDGTIFLFYKAGKKIPKWQTFYKTSTDNGVTWSDEAELVEHDKSGGRGPVKNKPILLDNGIIVAPSSVETKTKWDCFIDVSHDGGKTWNKSELIPFDHSHANGKGIIQPTLWEHNGKIQAFLRSSESHIMTATTNDLIHWTPAVKTVLPNNNSGIDCVKVSDKVIIIFNPIASDWGDRNIIAYSITDENASTFSEPIIIEQDDDKDTEFSYPAIISDEKYVYITYTHYRKTIMFRKFEIIKE